MKKQEIKKLTKDEALKNIDKFNHIGKVYIKKHPASRDNYQFTSKKIYMYNNSIKNILPAIGNQFVYVLKMSSLVSIIGISSLLTLISSGTFNLFLTNGE